MLKKFEFATGGSGDGGAEKKKIGVVYPSEVQRKLDDALGVVEKAGSPAERAVALKAYQQLIEKEAEQVKLVEFRGEKIHNYELQALQKIVEQINEDYAEQRKVDPRFEHEDMGIDDLEVEVEGKKVKKINLCGRKLKKIPEAIGSLINLRDLWLFNNQITEISGLESLINLEALDLGRNRITEIVGLDNLIKLKKLALYGNRIIEISGLENLIELGNLWLRLNQIDKETPANAAELERLRKSGVEVEI